MRALMSGKSSVLGLAVVSESVSASDLLNLYTNGVRGIRLNLAAVADAVQTIRALPPSWWFALIRARLHLELHSAIGRIASLLPLVPQEPLVPHELTVVLDHFAKPQRALRSDETVQAVRDR